MPDYPTGETARKIKQRIRSLDKFIFLASNKAIESRWCNWEIGYGDAQKYDKNKFAIFPVKDSEGWKGSEFLNLYPVIEYVSSPYYQYFGNPEYGYYRVKHPDGTKELLKDWLKK